MAHGVALGLTEIEAEQVISDYARECREQGRPVSWYQARNRMMLKSLEATMPECDISDDVQDHHNWSDDALPVCLTCGALSQAWEE